MTDEPGLASIRHAPDSPPDAAGDDELVAAALRDPAAFARLYSRYVDRVLRYALARTGSAGSADDVTSDTFVAALEGLARFDPVRGSFAAWLFTIAGRRIADLHRRRKRSWQVLSRHRPPPAEGHNDPLDDVIRDDEARRVRAALETLNDDDRHLVLLRYSAGLASREIGEVLGISPGAARTRLSRALDRLGRELGDDA